MTEVLDILRDDVLLQALLTILASGALIASFNDALAKLASKVPVVGWMLAPVIRRISPLFWAWLRRVADSAEDAVRHAETLTDHNPAKKTLAVDRLKQLEPGLGDTALSVQIEDALARIKGDAKIAKRVVQVFK